MPISILKLIKQLATKFDNPILCSQYASWILQAITQKSEAELAITDTVILSTAQQQQLDEWLEQLLVHDKPLQYILGSVPFGDVDILVAPPVLIPRSETEEWCMALIAKLNFLHNKNLTIIDLCCGSGCIAIALAKALPFATIIAVDIASQAVALTRKNAAHNNVAITVIQSDLFDQIAASLKADLIISNPPYISPEEFRQLEPNVAKWEDYRALVANEQGLCIIQKIIADAPAWIKPNDELVLHDIPQLVIEIGSTQADSVVALMKRAHYTAITVHKDLAGKDRVVSGRVAHVEARKKP